MVIAFIGTSCTKENNTECNTPILLKFKAVINVNGESVEAGKDDVKELILYVFNAQEEFIESHYADIGSTITLSYPNHEELHLVCWGNSASDQQTLPTMGVGDKLDESLIAIITDGTRVTQTTAMHPDNLFHSRKKIIINEVQSSGVEMVLYHKVASVSIIAEGLADLSTRVDEDYSYVFRSGKSHVNFTGNPNGDDVHHYQAAELIADSHESGIFNILPSDESAEVDIYKGADVIATISQDSDGNPIKSKEGELLNIRADFSVDGDINVSVAITPWGEKKIWKNFE